MAQAKFSRLLWAGVCALCLVVPASTLPPEVELAGLPERQTSKIAIPYVLPSYWHHFGELYSSGLVGKQAWYRVPDDELVARFSRYEQWLSGVVLYRPAQVSDERPLVFWVVHGTWARGSAQFWSVNDPVFLTVIEFATELARRHNRPIEIVSYDWSAEDSHEARREAGGRLRELAEAFYSPSAGYGPLWALGHSHGVNVIFVASQETSFDTVISLGAPVISSVYSPLHVKTLYHFYSLSDPVQKAGAFDRRSLRHIVRSSQGVRIYTPSCYSEGAYNFRVLIDGLDPGHLSLKFVLPSLWDVIDLMRRHYQYHTHFNVNISRQGGPSLGIRDRVDVMELLESLEDQKLSPATIEQFRAELSFSKQQEYHFSSLHRGRKLGAENRWWQAIFANWIEAGFVAAELMPALRPGIYAQHSLLKEPEEV